jgi:biopolymer transport protein ExbB/TolQ
MNTTANLDQEATAHQSLNVVSHIINDGTVFLWILVASSVVVLAYIIERFIYYYTHDAKLTKFYEMITEFIRHNRLADAVTYCNLQKHYLAPIAKRAIEQIQTQGGNLMKLNYKRIEESMDTQKIVEKGKLEKNIGLLATMGNIAPFIGLLGTVVGILFAFDTLANPAAKMGPKVIMGDISEALIATAAGLVVAIPAVVMFNFFSRKVKSMLANMDIFSSLFISHLESYKENDDQTPLKKSA